MAKDTHSIISGGTIFKFSKNSLFCLSLRNPIRRFCMALITHRWFDKFILSCIIINSLILALYNYGDRDNEGQYNQILDIISQVLTFIFFVECLVKVVAFGFIIHKHSYLREPWNVIDFTIVISGLIDFLLVFTFQLKTKLNLKALRNLRVLRPLKSINQIPSMKRLVSTLFRSFPGLVNVTIFLSFIFTFFGILGIQFWNKTFYNRCRITEKPLNDTYWEKSNEYTMPCSTQGWGGFHCPPHLYCGNPLDYGISIEQDGGYFDSTIQFGMPTFDNFYKAFLGQMQIITKDAWATVMNNMSYSYSKPFAFIFCFLIILITADFIMNLILAVFCEAFKNEQQLLEKEKLRELEEEQKLREQLEIAQLQDENKPINPEEQQEKVNNQEGVKDSNQSENTQRGLKLSLVKSETTATPMQTLPLIRTQDINNAQPKKEEEPNNMQKLLQLAKLKKQAQQQIQVENEVTGCGENYAKNSNPLVLAVARKITENKNIKDLKEKLQKQKNQLFKNKVLLQKMKVQFHEQISQQKQYSGLLGQVGGLNENIKQKFLSQFAIPILIRQNTQLISLQLRQQLKAQLQTKSDMSSFKTSFKIIMPEQEGQEQLKQILKNKIFRNEVEMRAQKSYIYKFFSKIVLNQFFNNFILFCIIANTIILTLDKFHEDPDWRDQLIEQSNYVFYAIFTFEMICKLIGIGLKNYVKDKYNGVDFVVILVNTIDIALTLQEMSSNSHNDITAFKTLRAMRLIRIFKLATKWETLNSMLTQLGHAVIDISTFCVLLFLFIFTYTILGMEWFAHLIKFDYLSKPNLKDGLSINQNFDSFIQAVTTVFVVLTGDGWCDIFYKHYRAKSGPLASFFFLTLKIVGEYILLLLLLAILIEHFDEESLNQQHKKKKQSVFLNMIKKILSKLGILKPQNKSNDDKTDINTENTNEKRPSAFRSFFIKIVSSKPFEYSILFFIFLSSIHIAIDHPLIDETSYYAYILKQVDITLTVIFSIELVMKVIAFGILFNGPKSYLRNTWNIMDCFIVLISVIYLFHNIQILSLAITQIDLQALKIIRMLRVLRPLRVISRNQGLRVLIYLIFQISIKALFSSLPSIFNAILISLFFFFIFGVIGVSFFKGLYFQCYYTEISYLNASDMLQIQNGTWKEDFKDRLDCLNYGGEWIKYDSNFDSLGSALAVLFPVSQTFSWTVPMYWATYAVGINKIQQQNASNYSVIYFIVFVIVMNYLITNLFVGVVVGAYNREKEKLGDSFIMTEEQKKWSQTKLMVIKSKPKMYLKKPNQCFRMPFYKLSISPKFENVVQVLITLNTLQLALVWNGQSDMFLKIMSYVSLAFTILFDLEVVIKLTGLGLRYFADRFNVFDFIIAAGSTLGIILEMTLGGNLSISTAMRVFRIGRMFKLFRKHQSLYSIFEATVVALPGLINVGGLLLLFIFIYSVLAMNFFATLKFNGPMSDDLNFRTVLESIISLLDMRTGDNFYELTVAAMKENSINFDCIPNPTYEDYKNNNYKPIGCGNSFQALLTFFSFSVIVGLIFLNLFIAIILQGYQDSTTLSSKLFNSQLSDKFRKVWSYFDQDATGFIFIEQLPRFMLKLGQPLGWSKEFYKDEKQVREFLNNMSVPIIDKCKIRFADVLEELVMAASINQELNALLKEQGINQEENEEKNDKIIETKQRLFSLFKTNSNTPDSMAINSQKEEEVNSQKAERKSILDNIDQEIQNNQNVRKSLYYQIQNDKILQKQEEQKEDSKSDILDNLPKEFYEGESILNENNSLQKPSLIRSQTKSLIEMYNEFEEGKQLNKKETDQASDDIIYENIEVEEVDMNNLSQIREFVDQNQFNDYSYRSNEHENFKCDYYD